MGARAGGGATIEVPLVPAEAVQLHPCGGADSTMVLLATVASCC